MNTTILGGLTRDERMTKALFGLDGEKMRKLGEDIERLWTQKLERRKGRKRAVGGGRKGGVPGGMAKAALVLFYLKVYPTFDLLSAISGIDRSGCCRWVHELMPLLEEALRQKLMLPKRKIGSMDEFYAAFPLAREVCVDGMERPTQRPKKKQATASTTRGRRSGTRGKPS
jgi:hypothetical protein